MITDIGESKTNGKKDNLEDTKYPSEMTEDSKFQLGEANTIDNNIVKSVDETEQEIILNISRPGSASGSQGSEKNMSNSEKPGSPSQISMKVDDTYTLLEERDANFSTVTEGEQEKENIKDCSSERQSLNFEDNEKGKEGNMKGLYASIFIYSNFKYVLSS